MGEPRFAPYGHYLDDLVRRAAHTRSAEVEEVLGLVSDAFAGPFAVYSALTDSDVVFAPARRGGRRREAEVTQGSIDALLASPDRALRRSAWESYADGYLGVRNTLAANLAGAVKQAVFSARVRRHESPLAASLSRSNVPVEVFDNLIATFEANLPTWHRYWRLRRRIHGVDSWRPTTSRRRSAHPRRRSSTSSASSGSARRSRRSARSTPTPSGAAASRSAGSTSTRPPGRWAARSPPARPGRRRSS